VNGVLEFSYKKDYKKERKIVVMIFKDLLKIEKKIK